MESEGWISERKNGFSTFVWSDACKPRLVRATHRCPFAARLENAMVSYVLYLKNAVLPTSLVLYYLNPGTSLPAWQRVGPLILILAISANSLEKIVFANLFACGLVLVPENAGAGSRDRAGRRTKPWLIGMDIFRWMAKETRRARECDCPRTQGRE